MGSLLNPSNAQPIVKIYYIMLPQKLTIHQLWNMTRQVSQTHNDMTTIPSLIIHTLMCPSMHCSNSNLLLRARFLLVQSNYFAIHANTWILVRTVSKPCVLIYLKCMYFGPPYDFWSEIMYHKISHSKRFQRTAPDESGAQTST